MEDYLSLQLERQEANRAKRAAIALQEAKLKALQDTIGNYGNFKYVDLEDFIDPDNQNWNDYKWSRLPAFESAKRQEHIDAGTPVGMLIQQIRDAKNTDDVKKQLEVWNSYKPLDSSDNGTSYIRYFIPGFGAYRNTPSIGSRPVFPTTDESDPVKTTAGGAQGTQGVQGAQAGAKTGNAVAGGGVQGSNNGSGKKPRMSDAEINAFLNEELGGDTTGNGTYASAGVSRGGTKTIGYKYDPNPNNVALGYKYDPNPGNISTGSTGYATGQGMLTSSTGGTYATGEGIKDANGNVLTNPGGNWEYQLALRDPQYGLGMMNKMSDAQKNYLQAVSDNMGFNYNFNKGAPRYV